jgi:anaerobic magnesium-protoporphyrin IX monomethyl ester cyclase
MEMLLIMPRYIAFTKSTKPNYNYSFPMGLSYIYSVIKQAGYHIDAYNLNHEEGKVEDLVKKKLDSKKYDIVGIGGMAIDYQVIEKIVNITREHSSHPLIILGGAIITSNRDLVSKNINFDIGVIGEGEITIIELLKKLEKKESIKNVKGICYKEGERIIFTSPQEQIEDLDSLPFPDYEAFGFEKVLENQDSLGLFFGLMDYPRAYPLLGSRGCAFQCTFCYHSIGSKYRKRSVDNIIEELEFAINKYRINSFVLNDDLFSANKERLYDFCEKIKKLNRKYSIKLSWWCSLWVGTVDEKMLKTLKEAGCFYVGFGFESYSKDVLKSMKKPITPEQIDNAIKLCMKVNMPVVGNFIFGDINETKKTSEETLNYWKENCKGQVKLFFIHPYPGSEVYKSCLNRGIIKDELNFIKNEIHHTYIRNMTLKMGEGEFEHLKKEVYELTRTSIPYRVPFRIKRENKEKYSIYVKCPYCKKETVLKNSLILNKNYFSAQIICRECHMKYNVCSRLYKFTMDNYVQLDFLRKNYLIYRDKFLRSRI